MTRVEALRDLTLITDGEKSQTLTAAVLYFATSVCRARP